MNIFDVTYPILNFSHSSGQWRSGKNDVVCVPKCNLRLPCREGYFCNRLTGDIEDHGKCIKSTKCPRSPPFSNGILAPDVSGVLGSKATFRCPNDKRFTMINHNRKLPMGNGTVDVRCTSQGWRLSDGSNGETPVCIRGNIEIRL